LAGLVEQCGIGVSNVAPLNTEQQATMMQVLQADRRRRLLEYQQRKKLERGE